MNKLERKFVSNSLIIRSFDDLKPYFDQLKEFELTSAKKIYDWQVKKSELDAIISEDMAWRYIKMTCNTADQQLADHFNYFVTEIEPKISIEWNELNKKFTTPEVLKLVDAATLFTVIREAKKELEIFREENIPLEAKMQQKEQEYGTIASKMNISFENKELTLQQAANYLKNTDRNIREQVYHLINKRRLADKEALDNLLSDLITIRHKIAQNAGFSNFRDYKFKAMGRFDYGVEDCEAFHASIAKVVSPLVNEINTKHKLKLGYPTLRPWDLDVDSDMLPALKPFKTTEQLVKKTIFCFRDLDPEFGIYLNEMNRMGYLDLESRKNKAPGGFNYPLHESNVPFIFMNATGNLHDMITMLHEGGHAMHAFLCANLELVEFKETPSEIAELASMTMELITMDYWEYFFDNKDDLNRAKRTHLKDVISVLPWVATVDKFQHYLYKNPNHTTEQRTQTWLKIASEFGCPLIDYSGIEEYKANQWQKQLHIFEVPFYYIEYGFAQLGALAIWRNFRENPQKALKQYKDALKMGYTAPIPDTYKAAGIEFNFSESYITSLMDFVKSELDHL